MEARTRIVLAFLRWRPSTASFCTVYAQFVAAVNRRSPLTGKPSLLPLPGRQMPAIYQWPDMAAEGGLVAYGPPLGSDLSNLARQLVKVLNGSKPGDIPVEQPTTAALTVNLKTATALGLTVPPSLLARADEVIE